MMTLTDFVQQINRQRRRARQQLGGLTLLRAGIIACLCGGIASWLGVSEATHILFIMVTAAAGTIVIAWPSRRNTISTAELLLGLEIEHPQIAQSAFSLAQETTIDPSHAWHESLVGIKNRFRKRDFGVLRRSLLTLIGPAAATVLLLTQTGNVVSQAWTGARHVVAQFQRGVTLDILQGQGKAGAPNQISLSQLAPKTIELLSKNMVRVSVRGVSKRQHTVELWKQEADGKQSLFQSFQMTASSSKNKAQNDDTIYSLEISVSENVALRIPSELGPVNLAVIKVKKLPIPEVWLSHASDVQKSPWPDDQPLPLRILVKAKHPLQRVQLNIISDGKRSSEVVSNVLSDDKFTLETEYELLLEPYLERDIAQVEIYAEAIDRAIPSPLIGRSQSLLVQVASAYGRYQQTLSSLRALKAQIDKAVADDRQTRLDPQAATTMQAVMQQADDSPFFDGLDRLTLQQIQQATTQVLESKTTGEELLNLSTSVNDFLFEHETLDDKERDRDFFVSLRGLSRLIEQSRDVRPTTVTNVTTRIRSFLTERQARWALRVARLSFDRRPQQWPHIEKRKPFQTDLRQVDQLDAQGTQRGDDDALQLISKMAVAYRTWIEALEQAEEQQRQLREQERQQGITDARNVLRDLQKRQGSISSDLDRAKDKQTEELARNWNLIRMEQNTNINETKSLEAQMRAFSPLAGERIKLAVEFMNDTLESGNAKKFVAAESNSDRAGRLLRQADNAARQSQQQKQSRGRRRRISGDGYYGQSVIGGDVEIKRDYQVDRRYREDVLEDIRETSDAMQDQENRALLEHYLREIIR